jgi:hypothetical protein
MMRVRLLLQRKSKNKKAKYLKFKEGSKKLKNLRKILKNH